MWSVIMWLALLASLLALAAERSALVFRHLWMMALYGLGMVVLHLLVGTSLSVEQIASLLHVTGDSQVLFSSVRTALLPYAGMILWFLYPVGYLGTLFQRFQIVRGALGARGRPQQVVAGLSHRGEDIHQRPRPQINDDWK